MTPLPKPITIQIRSLGLDPRNVQEALERVDGRVKIIRLGSKPAGIRNRCQYHHGYCDEGRWARGRCNYLVRSGHCPKGIIDIDSQEPMALVLRLVVSHSASPSGIATRGEVQQTPRQEK